MPTFGVADVVLYSIEADSLEEAVEFVQSDEFHPEDKRVDNITNWETLPEKEFLQRTKDARFLGCLEAIGVDNWSGFGMAHDLCEGKDPF